MAVRYRDHGDARAQAAVHFDLYYLLATSTPDTALAMVRAV